MTDSFPSVAVVILNWNGRDFLERFLPSVCASDYPNLQVFLADNASTDESVPFVREYFPKIRLISNTGNVGFAEGYNQALRRIKADYYVLLNQDVRVEKDWIRPVIELMEATPRIGACQSKIRSEQQPDRFEYAGAAGGWMDRWGYAFCRGRIFEEVEADRGQYDSAGPVFWASGAAFFIRSALYHEAGGLDAYFFAHMEEIDLCWRIQRMGYEVWCCPDSVVYHVGGGSLPRGDSRKAFLNFRNNLIMLYKNLYGIQRYATLFIRCTLDGIAGVRSIFMGNTGELKAILKAHYAFYGWLFSHSKDSHNLPPTKNYRRLFGSIRGGYGKSLVWQYFILKKRTFSSLGRMR